MGPRKLSKDRAEYRLAVLSGEEPYDYSNDPTSEEVTTAVQTAIDTYVAGQEKNITTAQGKIDTANATIAEQTAIVEAAEAAIAEQQAILDDPNATEEQKAAAQAEITTQQAAITAAQKKITTAESTIATQEKNIATYQSNIENAATKVTTINIEEVPETLTLADTGYKTTIKADFAANDETTIQANEKIDEQIQIQNTGDPANVTIDLGNASNVNLAGQWNEVTVLSVGTDSMTIAVGAHVNKLVVKKGHVIVKNAFVYDNVDEVVVEGGVVEANKEVVASKMGDFYNNPAVIKINSNLSFNNIVSGILTMGHFVYENNARVDFTRTGSTSAGFMLRGANLLAEFKGEGEWHSANNPCIWLSDFDGVIKIHSGKFFNDANTSECIYAEKGFIEIYGGEFHNVKEDGVKDFLLNCLDANYQSGKAGIKVYGGKFYGFDPAANGAESSDNSTNFVAQGYKSVFNEEGGYYEVVVDEDATPEPEPEPTPEP